MRTSLWLGALTLTLALAAPVRAQQPRASSLSSFSASPRLPVQNSFKVVDTTSPNAPIAVPQAAPTSSFSLLNYLPFTHRLSNQRTFPTSVFPTQSQLPGMQYINAFGFQRPRPAQ